jgi:hypothetical protein
MELVRRIGAVLLILVVAGAIVWWQNRPIDNSSPSTDRNSGGKRDGDSGQADSATPIVSPVTAMPADSDMRRRNEWLAQMLGTNRQLIVRIHGVVQGPDGAPVGGAAVGVYYRGERHNVDTPDGFTGDDGKFEIDCIFLPGISTGLMCRASGFATSATSFTREAAESGESILVRLERESTISGRVLDVSGNPVTDVLVKVFRDDRSKPRATATVDENGEYVVHALEGGNQTLRNGRTIFVGDYSVVVREPGVPDHMDLDLAKAEVKLDKGQALTALDFVVTGMETRIADKHIAGRVLRADRTPIADAEVWANDYFNRRETKSNDRGEFRVEGFRTGQVYVQVAIPGYVCSSSGLEVSAGDEDIEFVLEQAAFVEGQVVDAASGDALTVFSVVADGAAQFNRGMGKRQPSKIGWQRDGDGRFRIQIDKPGEVRVAADADGYLAQSHVVTVNPGATVSNIRIALQTATEAQGHVYAPDGTPVEGASIYIGEELQKDHRFAAHSSSEGHFYLSDVKPGRVAFWLWHPAYSITKNVVNVSTSGEDVISLKFLDPGTVEGVVTRDGAARTGADVSFVDVPHSYDRRANTGDDGTFVIEGAPLGQHLLRAEWRADNESPLFAAEQTVDVLPGESVHVALELIEETEGGDNPAAIVD